MHVLAFLIFFVIFQHTIAFILKRLVLRKRSCRLLYLTKTLETSDRGHQGTFLDCDTQLSLWTVYHVYRQL